MMCRLLPASIYTFISACLFWVQVVHAMGDDDPWVTQIMIHQLELRETAGENPRVWDASIWTGMDLQKLWLKTEGEREGSETDDAEVRLLYGQAISPYWDLMLGVKKDLQPHPSRSWLELGVQGTAPYFIETEVSLFVGESGRSGLRIDAEQEWMLTQRWVLIPEVEINFFGHNDRDTETGSGLSSIEAGLRLAYEVRKEFAPYIGINWERSYGKTADYIQAGGESPHDTQWVVGLKAWY